MKQVDLPLPDQLALPWRSAGRETCRRCDGAGRVYYVRTPGVEVVGGKRITCPECDGSGSVSGLIR